MYCLAWPSSVGSFVAWYCLWAENYCHHSPNHLWESWVDQWFWVCRCFVLTAESTSLRFYDFFEWQFMYILFFVSSPPPFLIFFFLFYVFPPAMGESRKKNKENEREWDKKLRITWTADPDNKHVWASLAGSSHHGAQMSTRLLHNPDEETLQMSLVNIPIIM